MRQSSQHIYVMHIYSYKGTKFHLDHLRTVEGVLRQTILSTHRPTDRPPDKQPQYVGV